MKEIVYKQPYIQMFEEIKNGLIVGDFSVESISDFLDSTSDRFFRDSKDCSSGNSQIRTVANTVREELKIKQELKVSLLTPVKLCLV